MDQAVESAKRTEATEAALLFDKDKTLLIVDDDKPFLNRLAKAMAARALLSLVLKLFRKG